MSDGGTPFETARSRPSSAAPLDLEHSHETHDDHEDMEMDRLSSASDDYSSQQHREITITFNPDVIEPTPNEELEDDDEEERDERNQRENKRIDRSTATFPQPMATPSQPDFIRVVLEFLINEGYKEAAEALCLDTGIELPKEEADYLDARVTIRAAIEEGRVDEAITKVNELCPQLLCENPTIHFLLMQQNLIEMIRNGETEKALEYAQTHIAGKDNNIAENQLDQLEKTFALLAFENPQASPFGSLLDQTHRQQVSNTVNAAVLGALNKPSRPKIEVLFKMLVFAQQQMHAVMKSDEPVPDAASIAMRLFQDQSHLPSASIS
ncbi:unnamed protein product, partial [Mesorhabditis belari]|uniref:CTLH domain-containing protein n=1 Tax=Mesorhabditis belari TaxID=2138241 RepID=A0AAF3EL86_9BILA